MFARLSELSDRGCYLKDRCRSSKPLVLGLARVSGSILVLVWALSGLPSSFLNLGSVDSLPLALLSSPLYAIVLAGIEGARYWVEALRHGVKQQRYVYWARAFVLSRPWVFVLPMAVAAEAAMYLGGKCGCESRPMVVFLSAFGLWDCSFGLCCVALLSIWRTSGNC